MAGLSGRINAYRSHTKPGVGGGSSFGPVKPPSFNWRHPLGAGPSSGVRKPGAPGGGGAPAQGGNPAATPATQPVSSLPVDPLYDAAMGAASQRYGNTLAGANYEEGRVRQDFGLDLSGFKDSLGNDLVENPFNRAKLLKQAYQQRRAGTTTSMAAQGQLYSGALQNAQDTLNTGELQDSDQLLRSGQDALAALGARRVGAKDDLEQTGVTEMGNRVGRALTDRPDGSGVDAVKPVEGFKFVQESGPRSGLSYNLVKKNGKWWRVYSDGSRVKRA